MYDNIATLIKYEGKTYDKYLNEHTETTRREVYVQPRSVYNSEFYNAQIVGLQTARTMRVRNSSNSKGRLTP